MTTSLGVPVAKMTSSVLKHSPQKTQMLVEQRLTCSWLTLPETFIVTSAGWQVILCDHIRHVSSRSGEAGVLRT